MDTDSLDSHLPALPSAKPPRAALVPESSDFLEGDAPAAGKVEAFLARALALIEAGLPPARAARQLGIGRSALYRVLAERKIETPAGTVPREILALPLAI
jgi:hypothetical protein